ncbi:MAG: hypothetical protein RLZZ70_772, partial [Candidatus Parcubacteria bacterium]
DMDAAGYRPLTFSELVTLGYKKPKFVQADIMVCAYNTHVIDNHYFASFLGFVDGFRCIMTHDVRGLWGNEFRFLFVRKS